MIPHVLLVAFYLHTDLPMTVTPDARAMLRHQCIADEILNAPSANWFDGSTDQHDLQVVRQWYREFREMPHVGVLDRLPDESTCAAATDFADAYLDYLRSRRAVALYDADAIDAMITETEKYKSVWCSVREAHWQRSYDVRQVRESLAFAVRIAGPSIYSGVLPPPVPLHQFRDLK